MLVNKAVWNKFKQELLVKKHKFDCKSLYLFSNLLFPFIN